MPAEFNRVILLGNLTRDPELRYLDSGAAVVRLGLAANRTYTDGSGEQKEDTCFIDVSAWGRLGELCHQYLRKGSKVLVEGRLTFRQWETDAGERRSRHEIQANSVQFLDRPGEVSAEGPGETAQREEPEDDIPF
jgi:single-strand DNA-binding protein